MKCCGKKKSEVASSESPSEIAKKASTVMAESEPAAKSRGKCALCLSKFICCRKTNKIESMPDDSEEIRKCCFCIPCRRKKKENNAWSENRRESILSEPAKK